MVKCMLGEKLVVLKFEDGNMPIVEVLVNGEIEVIEIMKELNANI